MNTFLKPSCDLFNRENIHLGDKMCCYIKFDFSVLIFKVIQVVCCFHLETQTLCLI